VASGGYPRLVIPLPSDLGANTGFDSTSPQMKTGATAPSMDRLQTVDQVAPAANLPSEKAAAMPNADDLTDTKIKLSEAETEIKIVRMEGKIDTAVATLVGEIRSIGDKISFDHEYAKTTRWALIGILIGGFFAVAGLIVTMAVMEMLYSAGA
jgi:hypothetical protein